MKARCLHCDANDWQNIDEHIHREQGAFICRSCGFVTYDSILKKEEMKEFYRDSYRPAPTVNNEYTCERKNHYHMAFLKSTLKSMSGKKASVFESGAAYGRLLSMVRNVLPDATVTGTELTKTMRRVAKHKLGIDLTEDFDSSKKYDLIMSYKVAEHIPDIDIELRKYAECLTDDGFVYIGVPVWFKTMNCFGLSTWSMADYYHPNHINMWTREIFQSLLKKAGLEVVKSNFTYYDDVYLCKRNDDMMNEPLHSESYQEIIERMKQIKKSDEFHSSGDFKSAIEMFVDFPDAYVKHYEMNRAKFHELGLDQIVHFLNQAMENCPESSLIRNFAADVLIRYDEYEKALEVLNQGLAMRPNDPIMLKNIARCFRSMKNFGKAMETERIRQSTSIEHWPEAVTMEMFDASNIPLEGEIVFV